MELIHLFQFSFTPGLRTNSYIVRHLTKLWPGSAIGLKNEKKEHGEKQIVSEESKAGKGRPYPSPFYRLARLARRFFLVLVPKPHSGAWSQANFGPSM